MDHTKQLILVVNFLFVLRVNRIPNKTAIWILTGPSFAVHFGLYKVQYVGDPKG
jgi:hypothetical protein